MIGTLAFPTILAVYSPPHSPPSSPFPSPRSRLTQTSTSSSFTRCATLPALPAHFTFPDASCYTAPSTLRVEWPDHGYLFNVPHLTDIAVLIDTAGADVDLLSALTTAGYCMQAADGDSDGGRVLLTCHRVVLSTASRVLRALIHDGAQCGAPVTWAATSLEFSGCAVVPLLWALHFAYSAAVVASIPVRDVVPTMHLARHLEMYALLASCEAHAQRLLSTAALLPLWSASWRLHEGLVLNAVTDFLVRSMRDVLVCSDFERFPPFLREVIGGLIHDSDHVAGDEEARAELIALFDARRQPPRVTAVDQRAVEPTVVDASAAAQLCEDATLTAMIRKQRAQPLFDALTSLCSLFFSPIDAGKTESAKRDRVNDLALSFGQPHTDRSADGDSDSDSDSGYSSADSDDEAETSPASSWATAFTSAQTDHTLAPPITATSMCDRMHAKATELPSGGLTIHTAAKPPRHPRLNRDRSCPLRAETGGASNALITAPARQRRPSAPSIF